MILNTKSNMKNDTKIHIGLWFRVIQAGQARENPDSPRAADVENTDLTKQKNLSRRIRFAIQTQFFFPAGHFGLLRFAAVESRCQSR